MRKVILQEFVSLDGLAAGPNDSVDFVPAATKGDQSFGQEQSALMDAADTILLGRVTYSMFAGYWPNVTEGGEKPFADKLNATSKIVFSRTLDRAPWGTWDEARIVKNSAADEVATLKLQSGKDMVIWGSISLAQSVINKGPIDEYRLVVCPLVLGSGRPLFGDKVGSIDMKLLNAKTLDLGAVSLKYIPGQRSVRGRGGAARRPMRNGALRLAVHPAHRPGARAHGPEGRLHGDGRRGRCRLRLHSRRLLHMLTSFQREPPLRR